MNGFISKILHIANNISSLPLYYMGAIKFRINLRLKTHFVYVTQKKRQPKLTLCIYFMFFNMATRYFQVLSVDNISRCSFGVCTSNKFGPIDIACAPFIASSNHPHYNPACIATISGFLPINSS